MSTIDKFLNFMKLSPDNEDDYYYDDEDDQEPQQPEKKVSSKPEPVKEEPVREKKDYSSSEKITHINKPKRTSVPSGERSSMEVCVIKPSNFEDAREVTETLLTDRAVVLNLKGLDMNVAQRIIDFTSGSCFAIGGNLQKVDSYVFILTPKTIEISGDFKDIFSAGEFDVPSI